MGSWVKLLGIGANREPDVRELAPAAAGSAVRDVPVEAIHTNPFQPRRWFREDAAAQLAAIQRIGEASLTARETEQWVNLTLADAAGRAKVKPATAEKALASVRDVRMVLNVLRHMTSDLKREGVKVQMNQRQEDGFLKLELLIPLKSPKR